MTAEQDRAWLRSWPLLLVTVVLGVAAAYAFAAEANSMASIAAFAGALIFAGAWLATAVIEWHHRLLVEHGPAEESSNDG